MPTLLDASGHAMGDAMNQPVALVCGFGRCGSSLVMQMLAAGGLPVTGGAEYPAYEDERYLALNLDWVLRAGGHAVKALDPQIKVWPAGNYRAIWLNRDPRQQAQSMAKFLSAADDITVTRAARRRLAAGLAGGQKHALKVLREITAGRVLVLAFEDIIRAPSLAARRIGVFLGGLDVERMAAVVEPRPTGCLSGMLELDLIRRAPPKERAEDANPA